MKDGYQFVVGGVGSVGKARTTTLRPIATITDPDVARKIHFHLGHRAEPLPRARARDPTGRESIDFDAA